jgi:hypothetical protein
MCLVSHTGLSEAILIVYYYNRARAKAIGSLFQSTAEAFLWSTLVWRCVCVRVLVSRTD